MLYFLSISFCTLSLEESLEYRTLIDEHYKKSTDKLSDRPPMDDKLAQVAFDRLRSDGDTEDMCLISMDLKNAYNQASRRTMYEAVRLRAPGLTKLFRTLYGGPSALYLPSGEFVGTCSTGVRQGCPCSTLFFSLGLQDSLEELQRLAQEVSAAKSHSERPYGVYGFADDITAYMGEKSAVEFAYGAIRILEKSRMKVRRDKCSILIRLGNDRYVEGSPFPVKDDGVLVLGNPVGTFMYVHDQTTTQLTEMAAPIPALRLIHPQIAMALVTYCFNLRPCYLVRVGLCPADYNSALKRFDSAVDEAVAQMASTAVTDELRALRYLPTYLGGLGLHRHRSPRSDLQCIASRKICMAYIRQYRPEILDDELVQHWGDFARRVGEGDESRYLAEMTVENLEIADIDSSVHPDILAIVASHKGAWLSLYNKLINEQRLHHAAWLLSSTSKYSGLWLTWNGGDDHRFTFTPAEYNAILRLRLLLNPMADMPTHTRCVHCNNVLYSDAPLHALECRKLNAARIWRHDRLRDNLAGALKLCEHECRKEVTLQGTVGERTIRADILTLSEVIDVAIVDPCAPCYLQQGSHTSYDVASDDRTVAKRAHWESVGGVANLEFIPFVVESTGRLGKSAEEFTRPFLSTGASHSIKKTFKLFLRKIQFIIARWNGRLILQARGHLGVRGEVGGGAPEEDPEERADPGPFLNKFYP